MVALIYELIDVQSLFGQNMLNVYHYLDADGVANPENLVTDFINDVIPTLTNIQYTGLTHTAIRYRQVYPTVELLQERAISPVVAGTEGGDPLASFAAYSMKFTLGPTVHLSGSDGKHLRRGGKRIAGVVEGAVSGDAVTAPGIISGLAAWYEEAKDPGTDPWQLVIVHQDHVKGTPVSPVRKYCLTTSCSAPGISTQNTRKVLRGRVF